jgi:DNA repair protein RadD
MQLRPYQTDAINSIYDWFASGKKAPLVVTPTGSGKSVILAEFIRRACTEHPNTHILVVTHVKELVAQDAKAIKNIWAQAKVGVYSAGLGKRQLSQITVASVQSIYKRPEFHGRFDLIIVDEAHLIPHSDNGMYRQLLDSAIAANPFTKLIGLTATPFRLDSGSLHEGDGALFDGICYEANVADLIKQGYLCKLTSRNGVNVDLDGIKKVGGDFNLGQLGERMSAMRLVEQHADLIVKRCQQRNSWLIFAVTVEHAKQICAALKRRGIACGYVSGDMGNTERDVQINDFKTGRTQALVNCSILTTGFDYPAIDAVVMLRPTMSAGLYVQMVGRGLRLDSTKTDCLVLDFGGNIMRHGFIDQVEGRRKNKGEAGEIPVKECPSCNLMVPIMTLTCPDCQHEFPKPERITNEYHHEGALLSIDVPPVTLSVDRVDYTSHLGKSGKHTLKVTYRCGLQSVNEYVCLDHEGYAKTKAQNWWIRRAPKFVPNSVDQALKMTQHLMAPKAIVVNMAAKFPEITSYQFHKELEAA